MKVEHREIFIKQFDGPDIASSIVCFRFHQAVIASGCPGDCAYCFLQTQYPYRSGRYDLHGTLFGNLADLRGELRKWLRHPIPRVLLVGENQDGLAFEHLYKRFLGFTPLQLTIPLFADPELNTSGHKMIVLSKFTFLDYTFQFNPTDKVIFSWSVNSPWVCETLEKGVPSVEKRFRSAELAKGKGWPIRFRLDPMLPHPNWREEYLWTIGQINRVHPEMVTIGSLRATNKDALKDAAFRNGRNGSIFDLLTVKDSSDFKWRLPEGTEMELYRLAIKNLDPSIKIALCKEDRSVWDKLGLAWNGCHCLFGASDEIVAERLAENRLTSVENT